MDKEPNSLQGQMSVKGFFFGDGKISRDERGFFSKVLNQADEDACFFRVCQIFWTLSHTRVVRGMHLQGGHLAGAKLVWVTGGVIQDVILDLRKDSETFGAWAAFEMSEETGPVLVPSGCAHGFEVLSGPATVNYALDQPYDSDLDLGVRWDSFGFEWKTRNPKLSSRDLCLPTLDQYLMDP